MSPRPPLTWLLQCILIANSERSSSSTSMTAGQRFWGTFIAAMAIRRVATGLRRFLVCISIFAVALTALRAFAEQDDVFNIGAGGTVTHDSNLFRAPESAGPISDTIHTGYVGLSLNKPYAQQRFQLGATKTAYRYDRSSELDFDGLSYRGAWLWHLGPRISGTLAGDRSESLVRFEDTTGTRRNVRVTENRVFDFDWEIAAPWHLLFGIARSKQRSEQAIESQPDFRSAGLEIGGRYLTQSGNSITFVQRHIKGNYLNAFFDPANSTNDGFRQYESELQANWGLNARSTVTGRLARLERQNDNFAQRDFSGLAGRITYVWTPTAKMRTDFSARRDISPWQDAIATYRVDNVLSIEPVWELSAKIALRGRLEHVQNHFRGGAVLPANGQTRRDTANHALVGVNWLPLRSLTVEAGLERQQRASNDALARYDATIATIGASFTF
jgi:exopolysaccharide biosynthesis operon protein EpsL